MKYPLPGQPFCLQSHVPAKVICNHSSQILNMGSPRHGTSKNPRWLSAWRSFPERSTGRNCLRRVKQPCQGEEVEQSILGVEVDELLQHSKRGRFAQSYPKVLALYLEAHERDVSGAGRDQPLGTCKIHTNTESGKPQRNHGEDCTPRKPCKPS